MLRGRYRIGPPRGRGCVGRAGAAPLNLEETDGTEEPCLYPLTVYNDQLPDEEFVDIGLVSAMGDPILARVREPLGYLYGYMGLGDEGEEP